ncbi:MAG: hypothetical protein KDH20_11005, partial [Rhodocyclaceae bacterium]|nr:hypothetical protein [Rhodocyclaceae bacterium]
FTSASAASRVVVIKIEPANEAVCMHEVEELRKGVEMAHAAGTAAALADEAAEDCKAGKYAMAEETLNDGHRALNRHKMRGK